MAVLDKFKKLSSRPICTSVYCFQSSLVWLRLLVLMNGCLSFGVFFIWVGGGGKTEHKAELHERSTCSVGHIPASASLEHVLEEQGAE